MEKQEMIDCLEYIKAIYPSFSITPLAVSIWLEAFGDLYTKREIERAVLNYSKSHDWAPNIKKIKMSLDQIFGERYLQGKKKVIQENKDSQLTGNPKLDLIITVLGEREFKIRVWEMLGKPNPFSWFALFRMKDWTKKYRALVDELYNESLCFQNQKINGAVENHTEDYGL